MRRIAAAPRPDWEALAKIFEKSGLTGRSSKPASAEAARKAWEHAKKAVREARAQQPPPSPHSAPRLSRPPTPPRPPAGGDPLAAIDDDDHRHSPIPGFELALDQLLEILDRHEALVIAWRLADDPNI